MITIKEIASRLHMSTTTVSNVIHGKTGEVSEETIRKVQAFLDEVGYVPNITARNLASNRSGIIGVVLKDKAGRYLELLNEPFVSAMIAGIEREIRQAGYFMMLYISDDIAEIIRHVATWNVDGLMLFWMLDDDGIRVSERYTKPIVCIDTYSGENVEHFVNVGLNDEQGGFDAADYLISRGHRRIAFLSDNKEGVDMVRFRGYRRALRQAGIEYSDRNFLLLRSDKEEVDASLDKLCDQIVRYGFTAVFASSDLFAVLLMDRLYDRGIRVPEDVSVIGFDDNLYASLHRPALTTIHQDVMERGAVAAKTLIGIIEGQEPGERQIIFQPRLVERDTVRSI